MCFKNWTIADHNPRASWREGIQAEDMMRAAYDMQVDDIIILLSACQLVTLRILEQSSFVLPPLIILGHDIPPKNV